MDDETKILIEYMKLSKNRQKVLKSFHDGVLRPSQIAILTEIHISSISKTSKAIERKRANFSVKSRFPYK